MEASSRWRVSILDAPATEAPNLTLLLFYRLGGMGGAIVTAPLDVVKTRLQSSVFHEVGKVATAPFAANVNGTATAEVVLKRSGGLLWNFVETGHLLK